MDLSLLTQLPLANSVPTLAMTWNPFVTNILVGVFLLISGGMILLVLIQRPQGGGLSGAFGAGGGGGGAGQTAFGTKTGDVLTGATITIFILFLLAAIVLNFATRPQTAPTPVPAVTTPAGEAANEAVDGQIEDAEQAIDEIMDSEPTLESDPPAETPAETEEVPASTEDTGTEEPAADDS